jgi:hypothetical protein
LQWHIKIALAHHDPLSASIEKEVALCKDNKALKQFWEFYAAWILQDGKRDMLS